MFGRVFVRRTVAATDVTAYFAQTQMHPSCADLQTIFAAVRAWRYFFYFLQMFAGRHNFLFYASCFGFSIGSRKRHESFVGVTPRPIFARFERCGDWMIFGVEMFRRVFIDRSVATADVTATQAQAQVNPFIIIFDAFLATVRASRFVDLHFVGVFTRRKMRGFFQLRDFRAGNDFRAIRRRREKSEKRKARESAAVNYRNK